MTKSTGLIGILGGLGPEAGRLLHGYIIEEAAHFKKITCDQDHYDVIHLAFPSIIPDRASYIFDTSAPDPTPIIFDILAAMGRVAEQFQRSLSVCIPCNTYHAPVLFDPLQKRLAQSDLRDKVQLLNLIEASATAVQYLYPGTQKIGLISTSGERASGIYRHYLSQQGIELVQVTEEDQRMVDDAIYNPLYGLKAKSNGSPKVREILKRVMSLLAAQEVKVVILGCTELPFVFDHNFPTSLSILSPMRVMAKLLIEQSEAFSLIKKK